MAQPGRTVSVRVPTVLCFDVEDLIEPATDDAVLWMAEMLTEHGLTGTFNVVGEKARLWEQRGRQDVIEALKRHHISFHSTWHSVHPTTVEICLDKDFREGMEALWEWDRQGWIDTERIIGRPLIGWARTGNSWAPQISGLMGRMGRAYMYSQVGLPGHPVCWFAGGLNYFPTAPFTGFDCTFYDNRLMDDAIDHLKKGLDGFCAGARPSADWVTFFMCHPTRTVSTDFWDAVNFTAGANPPREEWKPAPLHPPELTPVIKGNFRRLCELIAADDRLEVIGWGELIQRHDGQTPFVTHADLKEIAIRIEQEQRVLFTDRLSAAEILMALCEAATTPKGRYPRHFVYGPLSMPPGSGVATLNSAEVRVAAAGVLAAAKSGYLPPAVRVGGQKVGIGAYMVALAGAMLGLEPVTAPSAARYPAEAEAVAQEVARTLPEWCIHPLDMDLSKILEQTRLQCWTLKPALSRAELDG